MRTRVGSGQDAAALEREAAARCRLLFVTSEIADFLKVGGLGEVSAGLPRALRRISDARVLLPGYRASVGSANPADTLARARKVRTISPEQISSRRASATWTTTSDLRAR